jgi:hypothetical protein
VAAELLDLLKQVVDPERVLAHQAALQKESVGGAGAVPNLAESINILVRVETDDVPASHGGHAKIGDLERGGVGVGIDIPRRRLFSRGFPPQKRAAHDPGRGLEQIPPAYFAITFEHCRFLLSICWVIPPTFRQPFCQNPAPGQVFSDLRGRQSRVRHSRCQLPREQEREKPLLGISPADSGFQPTRAESSDCTMLQSQSPERSWFHCGVGSK